jgi:cyclopropane fatty-acyl-phospholipid synthase-like methyltransferase
MSNAKVSEEYKRYESSSVMKQIAQEAHGKHYCGQTSSATFDEICRILNEQLVNHTHKFLDAGCGNGCFSLKIAEKYRASVEGIDLSQDVINVAISHSTSQKLNQLCTFHVGDFTEIHGDERYTSILSVGSLYWSQDLCKTLHTWSRLLVENGSLIIFSNLENEGLSVEEQQLIGQTKFIRIDDMFKIAQQAGFVQEANYDETDIYCAWLKRWCNSMSQHLQEIIAEMGEDKAMQLVRRFKTYLKLANSKKVLRMILVYRKVI